MGYDGGKSQPFENEPKWPPPSTYYLKSGLFHADFDWSCLEMVGTIFKAIAKAPPFKNWTI